MLLKTLYIDFKKRQGKMLALFNDNIFHGSTYATQEGSLTNRRT